MPTFCTLVPPQKKLTNIENPVFIRVYCRIFQITFGKPNINLYRKVGVKTVIVTTNHLVSPLVSNSFLCFKFLKSVVGIIGVFNMWSLLVLTQQPSGPSGSDWRPETDVAARSCVFMCTCLVLWPAWNTCVCRQSVCTAVYLTQMFLLGLKCLFVRSGQLDPLVLFIFWCLVIEKRYFYFLNFFLYTVLTSAL